MHAPLQPEVLAVIELIIKQRCRDLGAFEVGRVLPFAKRRMIGPYIFFDRMGPKLMEPGLPREADVRPHPHIGLSTITYLFRSEEHTSELQSLMRISYAVFCFKNNTNITIISYHTTKS